MLLYGLCGGGWCSRSLAFGRRSQRQLEHDPAALAGRQGYVARPDPLRAGIVRPQIGPLDDRLQHHPHLVLGEGRTEAAAYAATERDPRVVVGLAVEEALGAELARLGEEVLAVVQRADRRQDHGLRRQPVAADLD